ncbi:peptide chain release factor N(5)-glutamine methyltransferase [Thalassotalea maritima]|uniref:peptide chain release factor N(5)-glutamine methyltransferase n=1 Tax=Thalassotalea maritima TaxID=3242416 RepID=UPI003527ED52
MERKTNLTIKQCLAITKHCFLAFEDAYDAKVDSEVLLSAILKKPKSYLLTWPEQQLTDAQYRQFQEFVERRQQGEPVAYIIGYQEFWSLNFKVAPCTLIPRPDTEVLIETVLENHPQRQLRLLDLGTGTGAIALALAHENPSWQVDAVDFNDQAVTLAKDNANTLQLDHVAIYQSDWFTNIDASKRFDIIVSNPPYIADDDPHLTQGDVRYEPVSALIAKNQGYADIIHIVDVAKQYLKPAGALYLEHGFEQHQQVQQILAEAGYVNVDTAYDYGGNPRITYGYLPD